MRHQFEHSSGAEILNGVAEIFKRNQVFQRTDRPLVFVCGGSITAGADSLRRKFLDWAHLELPNLTFVLAESVYGVKHPGEPLEFTNLSRFETFIAKVSDCLIIFPESAGSFAEVGLFSNSPVKKKTLIANNFRFQSVDSFVSLGPIATVDHYSYLRNTLYINISATGPDFGPIRERLSRLKLGENRRRIVYKEYKDLAYREKLAACMATLQLLRLVTLRSLYESLRVSFGSASQKDAKVLLSVLVASGLAEVHEEFFRPCESTCSLVEIEDFKADPFYARLTYYFKKHHARSYETLMKLNA